MRCSQCGGEMQHRPVTWRIERGGYWLEIDNVPAWICPRCGHRVLDDARGEALVRITGMLDEAVLLLRREWYG
ncbi:MAG: type II toxin-antitoxin system MqsA family antitoxin [Anaerolineae bacterium]|jgi:YgiT-type zinc finger domain-containing protein